MSVPYAALLYGGSGAGKLLSLSSNLYSQWQTRQLYRYQDAGYRRMIDDYNKNVYKKTGRQMRYPELGAPGARRGLRTHIAQSYAQGVGSIGGFLGGSFGSAGNNYVRSHGLYGDPGSGYRRM